MSSLLSPYLVYVKVNIRLSDEMINKDEIIEMSNRDNSKLSMGVNLCGHNFPTHHSLSLQHLTRIESLDKAFGLREAMDYGEEKQNF